MKEHRQSPVMPMDKRSRYVWEDEVPGVALQELSTLYFSLFCKRVWGMWRGENNLRESVLSSTFGFLGPSQILRLGYRCLYLLSRLIDPDLRFAFIYFVCSR